GLTRSIVSTTANYDIAQKKALRHHHNAFLALREKRFLRSGITSKVFQLGALVPFLMVLT
ncbi:MAG: hypothetical protein L3J28_07925, partial [Candidatus Polarisedimenticolaceae bacterium]|nr:hypothetical protein [Candidatus Polarisedimenticolaceae bacterium]